jgi:DNA-binding PadR family transcriptional regulator
MSATHAVLGLLLDKPAYPYELANQLQRRLGPAWAVNTGQLSQIIKRLEKEGLIERVDGAVGGREDRQVFAITENGVQEFDTWFATSLPGARRSRRPLLVKISLAGPERLTEALKQIDDYEDACAAELTQLMSEKAKILDGSIMRADDECLRLNLTVDIIQKEGDLAVAKIAREKVAQLREQNAVWPPARGRAGTASDDARIREGAREELFRSMADRPKRPASDKRGRGRAD